MSKKKQSDPAEAEQKAPETPSEDETAKAAAQEEQAAPAENWKAKYEELNDRYLRMAAEYDNFRKRTLNEKTAIYNNAVSDTVKELLPIADNIERALGQENASAEDMKKGVEMIEHQIQACFEKLGLEEMGKVGEAFDPNLHNAVAHIEDEALGENVIAAVYQKGYKLGDRVVRHAMVQVAN